MELLDLYTSDRVRTGKTMERGNKIPENCYRLVTHLCIFNSAGEMLIQHRQSFKRGWSNMWDLRAWQQDTRELLQAGHTPMYIQFGWGDANSAPPEL